MIVNLIFYGLIAWSLYLLATILPWFNEYKESSAFRFAHAIFGIYMLVVFVMANLLYFDDSYTTSKCDKTAPILNFFITIFIVVGYVILIIFGLSLLS